MKSLVLICLILTGYICFLLGSAVLHKNTHSDELVDNTVIDYLKTFNKGVLTSSVFTWETKNKLLSVDTKPNVFTDPYTGKQHTADIKLQVSYKNNSIDYYFTKNYLNKGVTVLIPTGSGYKKGTINDLKAGDTILFEKSNEYDVNGKTSIKSLSTKITKLSQ